MDNAHDSLPSAEHVWFDTVQTYIAGAMRQGQIYDAQAQQNLATQAVMLADSVTSAFVYRLNLDAAQGGFRAHTQGAVTVPPHQLEPPHQGPASFPEELIRQREPVPIHAQLDAVAAKSKALMRANQPHMSPQAGLAKPRL